jgi:glycerol kinase
MACVACSPRVILAIDQGTTGTTCLVFDAEGRVAGRAYSEFEQHFPRPGWVEHDAAEIWEVTRRVGHEALADAGVEGSELKGVGITNQRETVVAWDPVSGEPLHRALVWQDRRTAERCEELRAAGHEELVRERTGLTIDPYFSGTKIEWMLRNAEGVDGAVFGTVDSWLLFKLTGRHVTDYTNASRTMLLDIRRLAWDEELCGLLGIDPARLPEPLPSAHVFGTTSEFGGEVQVAGVAGDQQAALFGQACQRPGMAKNTYGTGSFVLLNTGAEPPPPAAGLIGTVAWGLGEEVAYALEASIFVTGAAVQWLRDGLGIIDAAEETEALAASLDSNEGVYFVPALTGLGSPQWDPYARGTIVGLTRGSGPAHLARAALESIAYATVDAVRAQEEASGERLEVLKADGGAVANRWLMQFQADVLGAPVVVPEIAETTALGAAYLAGIATGLWSAG